MVLENYLGNNDARNVLHILAVYLYLYDNDYEVGLVLFFEKIMCIRC